MKQFGDFLPVAIFFAVYVASHDLILATSVLIAATVLQLGLVFAIRRTIEKAMLYTGIAVIILGGLTVALHDNTFIKWKPTVVNWVFALALLGTQWFATEPLVKKILGGMLAKSDDVKFDIPDSVWRLLNIIWIAFFLAVGGINLFVAYHFDEATWVNFKLFGLIGLNAVFFIAQFAWLSRYIQTENNEA